MGAANKLYVDSEIAKIPSNALLIDGSKTMAGDLDMGDNFIDNVKTVVEDDGANPNRAQILKKAVNFEFFEQQRAYLKTLMGDFESDGSVPMSGNLNMDGNTIINIADPINDQAAPTRKYIDDRLKHSVQSSDTSNAFQYVMDNPAGQLTDEDDTKGIKKTDRDFHKINKETYEILLSRYQHAS